ncbi:hypothetical protein G6024_00650 [Dietzia maris]|uniref:Uncharacterized protein n=1 Tax=Dietzia maris TaxID=37915 RepID=A0AAE4QWH6_9ACTN|nr:MULTISPECIES: hypothetical protein [Dietzia]MBB0995633.1 hypothetical protein [Dietzia maris]MDV6299614.1 hypothetical protein [Dietzia maris]
MAAYTPPPPHRIPLPTRTPTRTKVISRGRSRLCALVEVGGLAVALLSLYLPWLSTGRGEQITALGITDLIDVRSVAPVLYLGLVGMLLLVAATAGTRLGAFALAAAVVAAGALVGHLAFVWILIASTGEAEPMLSGLPADASVTFGPYVAALGFVTVAAVSAWAAFTAEYVHPDPGSGHRTMDARVI